VGIDEKGTLKATEGCLLDVAILDMHISLIVQD
jgi:hypothetical protein